MRVLLKLIKFVKAGWGEASGARRVAGGKIVGGQQGIVRRRGSRHGPNGRSQQLQYAGTYARNGPLAGDMADGTGRSRGWQRLDLYPLHASRRWSFGNKRIDFVVMELQDEAEVQLGQQCQPSESTQAVSSTQAHENPQMPSVGWPEAILALHLTRCQHSDEGCRQKTRGAHARPMDFFRCPWSIRGIPGFFPQRVLSI
jgi:hypothetical protein